MSRLIIHISFSFSFYLQFFFSPLSCSLILGEICRKMESQNLSSHGFVQGRFGQETMVCEVRKRLITQGCTWLGCDPFAYEFPLFMVQILIFSISYRIIFFFLKPLKQSSLSCQILVSSLSIHLPSHLIYNLINQTFSHVNFRRILQNCSQNASICIMHPSAYYKNCNNIFEKRL